MIGQAALIASAILSTAGLLLVAGYVWARLTGKSWPVRGLQDAEAIAAFHRRRGLGAGLVAVISVGFFVGVTILEPRLNPLHFLLYWLIVLLLVIWLCLLVAVDVWHIRRHRRRRMAEAARRLSQAMTDLRQGEK